MPSRKIVSLAASGALAAVALVVLAFVVTSHGSTPAHAVATTTVYVGAGGTHFSNTSMTNDCGNPCITTISPGDTVHWVWQGTTHSTTSDNGSAQVWDSGQHGTGSTFDLTFSTAGTYAYHCSVHGNAMRGTIIVGAAGTPTDTPAATATRTSTPAGPSATPTSTPTSTNTPTPTNTPTHMPTTVATPTLTSTPAATSTPSGQAGDVNCSNTVDAIDAALVLQFDAGLVPSLMCQQNGDVNHDGNINSLDAALVLQFSAGLIGHLPV